MFLYKESNQILYKYHLLAEVTGFNIRKRARQKKDTTPILITQICHSKPRFQIYIIIMIIMMNITSLFSILSFFCNTTTNNVDEYVPEIKKGYKNQQGQ